MKTPDAFMPLYGNDFFAAVKDWPDVAVVGYMKALWHYWSHLHCTGLPDDSVKLRKICEIDSTDWDECMALIFDNDKFFKQDSNLLWRQKRSDEEWNKANSIMNKRHIASMMGVNARRQLGQLPPPKSKKRTSGLTVGS